MEFRDSKITKHCREGGVSGPSGYRAIREIARFREFVWALKAR